MKHYQIRERRRQIVAGTVRIHGEVRALRGDRWIICGVFAVTESEWSVLVQLCQQHGIPVVHDVETTSIPA
jgi:hypothetical protein